MLIFAGNMAKTPLQSIIYQFEAGAKPNPADHRSRIRCPTLILSGSEDSEHPCAFALKMRIPGCPKLLGLITEVVPVV
jgi:hypothetical protein